MWLMYDIQNKGQEDVKVSLDRAVNSICEQLSHYAYRESLQEIFSLLSALPEKIEVYIQKIQNDICKSFTKEMQACVVLKWIFYFPKLLSADYVINCLFIVQLLAGNGLQPTDP